jgi:hypothetical protein
LFRYATIARNCALLIALAQAQIIELGFLGDWLVLMRIRTKFTHANHQGNGKTPSDRDGVLPVKIRGEFSRSE